jgi:hypothetical protein
MFEWWKARLLSESLEPEKRRRAISRTWKLVVFFGAATILWVPFWLARGFGASELSIDTRIGLLFSMVVLLISFGSSVRELNLLLLLEALESRAAKGAHEGA